MAYLALYRMFRPTTLNDVVRQEHIVTILKNQIATGKIGHAYLFCGPRGTGKTSIAKIFANAINCEHPVDGSPCGKCPACLALKDPSNLDISEIDAASNNGVDEMRDLREKVQYPPVAGKYKVYIVDEVHMLSTGAFNALLKTLEEPPSHAVFILATTESQKIPATILSRCMRFDFKLIPQEDLENRLKYVLQSIGKDYEEEAVKSIARAGAGSVRDMLSLADTCVSFSQGKLTFSDVQQVLGSADMTAVQELISCVLHGDNGASVTKTEQILAEGKSVSTLVKDIMNFLNACTIAKTCRDADKILAMPKDVVQKLSDAVKDVDGHRILRTTEIFAKAENDLKYTVTPRIILETAVFKASMPEVDYDIESLISRITMLEQKIASGNFAVTNSAPVVPTVPVKKEEEPEVTEDVPQEEMFGEEYGQVAPPDENVTGGMVYSDEPLEMPKKKEVTAEDLKPVREVAGDSKATFGAFLRALRKIGRNGILYTLCMDLDSSYDGDTFVLYCTSETIYGSLTRQTHQEIIKQALNAVGVDKFDVRLKNKPKTDFNQSLENLKRDFPNTKIEIK